MKPLEAIIWTLAALAAFAVVVWCGALVKGEDTPTHPTGRNFYGSFPAGWANAAGNRSRSGNRFEFF